MIGIILSVVAWRRGWSAGWAFLPIGFAYGLGFLTGVLGDGLGLAANETMGVTLLIDLSAIVVLIYMIVRPPKRAEAPAVTPLEARRAPEPEGQQQRPAA